MTNSTQLSNQNESISYYEASARQRIDYLVDKHSFQEFIGPEQRVVSPHLKLFNLPEQFDDGIVIGRAMLEQKPIFIAAQEGRFMGGAIGEVHGAKLLGLIKAAQHENHDLVLLLDSGGVRLQEANAGEIAIAEIMRAVVEARLSGIKVVVLIGGRSGCYGGAGLISACASKIVMSEYGRMSVSGPEVIETNKGVEEFDSRDRALVWRTMGGKHRSLMQDADYFVADDILAFRRAAITALEQDEQFGFAALKQQQEKLENRLNNFGGAKDAIDIWTKLGISNAHEVPSLSDDQFLHLLSGVKQTYRIDASKNVATTTATPTQPLPDGLNQLLSSLFADQFTVTVSNNHIIGQASLNGTPCHIIGIANSAPIAIDDANILSRHIINIVENHPKQAILVLVDSASQNMSKRDELLGLNQYLSQLAKALIFASLNGHVTIGILYGHSAAGAFIASALATQSLIALPDAYPAVMDLPSMARVTKLSIDQLAEMAKATPVFAPGLLNLYKTGGIDEIWPNDGNVDIKAQKLLSLYQSLEGQRPHDTRAQLGLERGGRLKTLPLSNAVIKLANYDG